MKRILYIIGAFGLMVSSCAKNEAPQEGGAVVNFTAVEPTSRVSSDGLEWAIGDMIGVIQNGGSIVKYLIRDNITGAMSLLSGDDDPVCAKPGADYTAYYCAKDDLLTNVYPADITDQTEDDTLPLMMAKVENESGGDVTFNFEHQYVRLEFNLIAGNGINLSTQTKAKLVGANSKGNFDLVAGAWSDVTSTDDIDLKVEVDYPKYIVTAYVIAQESVKGNVKLVITTANSQEYTTDIATEKWESGKKYLYNVTVGSK